MPATEIVPLTGAIANLNWFDAQRKHYESPDQIARRFGLPDDAGMRAFCQGAAALPDRHTVQFVRRVPGTTEEAWSCLADAGSAEAWLFGVQWELREGGSFRYSHAAPGVAAAAEVAEFEPGRLLRVASRDGWTRFEIADASGSSRARRDVPNHTGPLAEFRLTDCVPASAGVPAELLETSTDDLAQPGGVGTHCVSVVAAWHGVASAYQKLAFERAGVFWPSELAVGLNADALVAAYAKLLAAHHSAG